MNPQSREKLSVQAAQIAIALAGFACVVIVFRREAINDWTPVDKLRLRLLLTNSIFALTLCMFGLLLLTIKPVPTGIWRWCSGGAFVVTVVLAATLLKIFRRLDLRELQNSRLAWFVFYLFGILAIAATLLQVYNAIVLGEFWPFFTAITVILTAAIAQFMKIILISSQ